MCFKINSLGSRQVFAVILRSYYVCIYVHRSPLKVFCLVPVKLAKGTASKESNRGGSLERTSCRVKRSAWT